MLLLVIIRMRNYSIIAYLQSFPMNVKKKNLTENKCYLFTHKTTNRIITPFFSQNKRFFSTPEQKLKTYSTNISYLFNRQQWSLLIYRVSQCQDTVQQEVATTNQNANETVCRIHMITIHIYHFYIE